MGRGYGDGDAELRGWVPNGPLGLVLEGRSGWGWRAAWPRSAAVAGNGIGFAGGGPVAGGVLGLGGDRVRPRRQDRARDGGTLEPGPHARFAALVDGWPERLTVDEHLVLQLGLGRHVVRRAV